MTPVMMGVALVTRPCDKRLDPIQLSEFSDGDVEAMARRYGLDIKVEADCMKAAEEVLATLGRRGQRAVLCSAPLSRSVPGCARTFPALRI
jgi:hypothetical protein